MAIQLSPETERLVEQEIASGRFRSVDEIILLGLHAEDSEIVSWRRHRETIEQTLEFAKNPIRLEGITVEELIDESRRELDARTLTAL